MVTVDSRGRRVTSIEVCIVAYDNAPTIGTCLESLVALGPGVRVGLADNHPELTTVSAAQVAARSAGVELRILDRPDNPGFAVACNALAADSDADWLLFLNPDAAVRLWPGEQVFRPGITGPRIYGANGRRQHTFGRRRSIRDEIARRLQIRPREPRGTGYVTGAAILLSRAQFVELGGFDERYFMYYEDIDLCRAAVEKGWPVRIEATWEVEHVGGYSAAKNPDATALRSYESARCFYEKWTGTTIWIDLVVLVDSALRVLAGTVRLPVPGTEGSRSTLPRAWKNLRERR